MYERTTTPLTPCLPHIPSTGFDQGPTDVSQVVDNVTISLRATKNDDVNCVALTDGAAAPSFVAATTAAPVVYDTVVNVSSPSTPSLL
jgi:hypothetical protein